MKSRRDILDHIIEAHGNRPFLKTSREIITFPQFRERIMDLSHLMCDRSSSTDTGHLAVIMCRRPKNFVLAYFAAIYAGLVPVPISELCKEREITASIHGAVYLLSDCPQSENIRNLRSDELSNELICYHLQPEKPLSAGVETAVLLSTSGSVGFPKRVMLSFDNIFANVEGLQQALQLSSDDSTLAILPFHYSFAHTTQLWAQFILGAPLILTDGPLIPKQVMSLCTNHQPVSVCVVAQSIKVLSTVTQWASNFDLSSIQRLIVAGGRTSQDLMESAIQLFPNAKILQGYGLTEAGPRVSMEIEQDAVRIMDGIRSSGKPLPNVKVKIVDSEYKETDTLQEGMITVCGPNVMKGYFMNDISTKKVFHDGWLLTGDIGFVDPCGYLYIRGRSRNMLVHKGFKVFPEEIESFVLEDPRIQRCRAYEEKGCYILEVQSTEITDPQVILERMKNELSYWKIPDQLRFTEIELTHNGKTKRNTNKKVTFL
ncbi:acyl-CoA synthetase (AMP-forming)/AMP-acid ligase II [Croceifilum oryzae]|uniref:Acyl-CoA synthetase (AMP-forming)/AMP-acid ligase II n=1 Tax=Croceifilum oryzae TaxID=1553429 RepID=A0AAJ1TGB4_9BACL|nr:class I adenylate-forming enzyme family protein [Croceifilum oryzae]MDQ0417969.1 acyl-CoA synthetase (AMP-forming)/AMP-acid ligase II [Croceifilum oryzae]